MENGTVFTIFVVLLLLASGGAFFLGSLFGREIEKDKWHKLFLKEVKRKKSLRWTATINIVLSKAQKKEDPKISLAVGTTKPFESIG